MTTDSTPRYDAIFAKIEEQKKRVHTLYARFISITTPDSIFA